MKNLYGPWATSIDGGGSPQLSTFWRRRLTRLVPTSRTSPALSRRSLTWLLAAGAVVFVLPTFRAAPVAAAGEGKPPERRKTVVTVIVESDAPADEDAERDSTKESGKPSGKESGKTAEKPREYRAVVSEWTLPDGTTMLSTTAVAGERDGGPTHLDEIKKCIAQKKYKPLKTFESPDGRTQYVYQFPLADGGHTAMNFSMPLEDVTSWEDYEKKQKQQEERRRERISQAVAAGRFRLINVDVVQIHRCRDAASGREFEVYRIARPDGRDAAMPRPDDKGLPPSVKRGTWQEHLQAIRDGKRELLGLKSVTDYTYEMIAGDGTKLLFTYGGDKPLKKPDEREQ